MEGRRAFLVASALLGGASAGLLLWKTLSEAKKKSLGDQVKGVCCKFLPFLSASAPVSKSDNRRREGNAEETEVEGGRKVLSRDDVKEIMKALLASACEAERNLSACISDNQAPCKAKVDQAEAIAMLIKSCAPLKTVRESTKEKFNVSEAEMIEAMDLYKTADTEIMELDSKIASTQELISEKSKMLVSLLAPAKLDRSQQKANEVTAT